MNYKQAAVIRFAVLLTVMSFLTPPWVYEDHMNSAERSAGYYFFTNQAEVKSDDEMRKIFSIPDGERPHYFTAQKDRGRLFCEWIAILFSAVGGLFLTVNRKNLAKTIISGLFFCIGLFFAAIVLMMSGIFIF